MADGYIPNEGILLLHNVSLVNTMGTKLHLLYGTILTSDHTLSAGDLSPEEAAFAGYEVKDVTFNSPSVVSGGKSVSLSEECVFTTTGEEEEILQTIESFYTRHTGISTITFGNLKNPARFKIPGDSLKLIFIHELAEGSI